MIFKGFNFSIKYINIGCWSLFFLLHLIFVFSRCSGPIKRHEFSNMYSEVISFEIEGDKIIYTTIYDSLISIREYNGMGDYRTLSNFLSDGTVLIKFKNQYLALEDNYGDEKFTIMDSSFIIKFPDHQIEKIISFNNGKTGLIVFKGEKKVKYIDFNTLEVKDVLKFDFSFNDAVFQENEENVIISVDNLIYKININDLDNVVEIGRNISGRKNNLSINEGYLLFVNNYETDRYSIYEVNLNSKCQLANKIHTSTNDLLLPKRKGGKLYYLEIVNSEYLLKVKDSKEIHSINSKGVVYNYSFYEENKLVYTYSDFALPRSLMMYDLDNHQYSTIEGERILSIDSNYKLIKLKTSNAYLFFPEEGKPKGIILYFRPGVHSDFSPRWGHILQYLTNNGFMVISPNFPMSFGYGKEFENASLKQAVFDIYDWYLYVRKNYSGVPIYFMASSHGNYVMEATLQSFPDMKSEIKCVISMFGIPFPSYYPKIPTLYIVGERDSRLGEQRIKYLRSLEDDKIEVKEYKEVGHGFRTQRSKVKASEDILLYLMDHK